MIRQKPKDLDRPKMVRNFLIKNEAEILQETYSVTVDWPDPDPEILQAMQQVGSLRVVHEEGSIYTIHYTDM